MTLAVAFLVLSSQTTPAAPVPAPESVLLRFRPPVGKPYDYRYAITDESTGKTGIDLGARVICKGIKAGNRTLSFAIRTVRLNGQDLTKRAAPLQKMRLLMTHDERGTVIGSRTVDAPDGFPLGNQLRLTTVYPEAPVKVGDSWTAEIEGPGGQTTPVTYSVREIGTRRGVRAIRIEGDAPELKEFESLVTWVSIDDGMLLSTETRMKNATGAQLFVLERTS